VEDKTYDLLEKMNSEFSSRFDGVENEIKGLKSNIAHIESNITRIEIKLEHNIENKIQALYDDRDGVHKKLDSIEQKIDELANRVDKQDVEIRVIKGGKPKASKG
jgi:SMC interacting uncharacterized protein involved in chromosome segregation